MLIASAAGEEYMMGRHTWALPHPAPARIWM